MGRFCILNFNSVFSEPFINGEILLAVKDCNCTFSCKNVILHTIKEQWIAIVKCKTYSPSRICSRHFEKKMLQKSLWQKVMEQC